MADAASNPSTPSIAAQQLDATWARIRTILDGAVAVRDRGERYLVKFPAEDKDEYLRRLAATPWRPIFEDIVRSISAKPLSKEVALAGDPTERAKDFAEDVDGRGNNLHNFAKDVFEGAVALGAGGVLIDFPVTDPNASRAQEIAAGVRPYWVSIDADNILAIRFERRGGKEVCVYLRFRETRVVRNGFAEESVDYVRELEPGVWRDYRKTKSAAGVDEWTLDREGTIMMRGRIPDRVPFVFITTGERKGDQYVKPPFDNLADMQIELYNALSNKKDIFQVAGAPMLTANGLSQGVDDKGQPISIRTGPRTVLFAPSVAGVNGTPSWDYLQPDAANLKEIREDIAEIITDMRVLGLQPLMPKTGNVTATASGIDAAKAHSAVQTWALALKDGLEQAFVLTREFDDSIGEVEVSVNTDFAIGLYGETEIRVLFDSAKEGFITPQTYRGELERRGVLGPAFDEDEESADLLALVPGGTDDEFEPADPNADPEGGQ